MNLKIVIGIILAVLGLGSGVWGWITSGLLGAFPAAGLIMFLIGIYLIISGIRSPKKSASAIPELVATPLGLAVGYALGNIMYENFKKYLDEKSSKQQLTLSQIQEIERKLDELYLQGKMPPDRYQRAKILVQELKRRHTS
ncbi:hypothetical protein [Infirmifilum sp.]|jgi:flagellar motor component MotA|uniref:hypothetical protein n=1 Tax=Infirmifilum sp. TaxID=2856575 RepID=UPI003D0F4450